MSSMTNAIIFPLKLLLTAAGALSIASGFRFCVSFLFRFSVSQAPTIWSSLRSWLRPPYLYFVINGIIILIVASSRFRYRQRNDDETEDFVRIAAEPGTASLYQSPTMSEFKMKVKYERKWMEPAPADVEEEKNVVAEYGGREAKVCDTEDKNVISEHGEETIPSRNMEYSMKIPSSESPAMNHPLVSPKFAYRKPVKSSLKGLGGWRSRSRRETKSKQQQYDTMDDTWKKITAVRETSENHDGREMVVMISDSRRLRSMKKSETFKDRTNYYNEAAEPPVRKESSLEEEEEVNRRAEEFIKKFNQEMKLQRQASLQQYMDMINRSAN